MVVVTESCYKNILGSFAAKTYLETAILNVLESSFTTYMVL